MPAIETSSRKRVVGEDLGRQVLVGQALEDLAALRPLEAQVRHVVGELADDDVGALGRGAEDLVVAVVRAAEADVVGRAHHRRAVVDHLPVLVRERAVGDLAGRQRGDVARDDRVDEVLRAVAVDVDLAQHREVHQPGRLAHRAVLLVGVGHDRGAK